MMERQIIDRLQRAVAQLLREAGDEGREYTGAFVVQVQNGEPFVTVATIEAEAPAEPEPKKGRKG